MVLGLDAGLLAPQVSVTEAESLEKRGNQLFNLLTDCSIPVVREDGTRDFIRPAQIADVVNPVRSIDWPRPDFCVATLEMLIGLLATACPPEGSDAWLDWWAQPPSVADLDRAFAPIAHAFNLDGPGPLFMQDWDNLDPAPEPIETLLIGSPGQQTVNLNSDLLVHRGRVSSLGRPAAAMALYVLQSWAPSGGQGNRVGLRGGGPLVTLVLPGSRATLWQTIWANVPTDGAVLPPTSDLPLVFPWLAPTVTSEDNQEVTPQSAHPLQCWWGVPRRIRLDFSAGEQPCGLTGVVDTVHVTGWRQRPWGAKYIGWGLKHPLTPYYQQRLGGEYLAHHQHGSIGYRQWLGLVLKEREGLRLPAASVSKWHNGRDMDALVHRSRILAAGYDTDNMKAIGFAETEMPLPGAADATEQRRLDDLSRVLVLATGQVAKLLRKALAVAGADVGATSRLWSETEAAFFTVLEAAAQRGVLDTDRADWLRLLRKVVLGRGDAPGLFDTTAPLAADTSPKIAPVISKARRSSRDRTVWIRRCRGDAVHDAPIAGCWYEEKESEGLTCP